MKDDGVEECDNEHFRAIVLMQVQIPLILTIHVWSRSRGFRFDRSADPDTMPPGLYWMRIGMIVHFFSHSLIPA